VGRALSKAGGVERERVLAFRLHRHRLSRRGAPGALVDVAGCAVQNTPPGSAALALHARVRVDAEDVARAVEQERSLVQVYALRQSPYFVPTRDLGLFTRALLPTDESSLRFLLAPILPRLRADPAETFERTATEVEGALVGRTLTKQELHAELKKRVPVSMRPLCEACKSHHVPVVLLRAVALRGGYCFAERQGSEAAFARTQDWLGRAPESVDESAARVELARRYLGLYGPSSSRELAEWAGIAPAEAERAWRAIESELTEVEAKRWILGRDAAALRSPPQPAGVRLLPPGDPYLAQRDRETLLPAKALRARVWRSIGSPGVVLVDGRLVATWKPAKKGKRLRITVQPFAPIAGAARSHIEAEVEAIAALRGCTSGETAIES